MKDVDWFRFVAGDGPDVISVTRLPNDLCRHIGCSSSLVRMRHDYALKCAHKHKLRAAHFPMLPIVIEHGFVISDKPRHLTFYLFENVVFGGWLVATIKATEANTELWVATYHVAKPAEAKRMRKKYRVIREHEE